MMRSEQPAEAEGVARWPPPPAVVDRLAGLLPTRALQDMLRSLELGELPRLVEPLGKLAGRTVEAALEGELTEHLGYSRGGRPRDANVRNGSTPKTVRTDLGPIDVRTPRDRDGSFASRILPKRQTELAGLSGEVILGLYAGGLTTDDVSGWLRELLGTGIGRQALSRVADAVLADAEAWRSRSLDPIYPLVCFDVINVQGCRRSVQDGRCCIALGVTRDGASEVLDIRWQDTDAAASWAAALDELRCRGVDDVLVGSVDELMGCAEAIKTTFPQAWIRPRRSPAAPAGRLSRLTPEPRLWTIGYERLLPPELIVELETSGIKRVLDVRFRPQSRRPGMSMTRLRALLSEHGIAYEHRRGLGTPPEIRWLFKSGRVAEGRERYAAHLRAQPDLFALASEVRSAPRTALLCLEAEPAECHRRVIVELLAESVPGLRITDL